MDVNFLIEKVVDFVKFVRTVYALKNKNKFVLTNNPAIDGRFLVVGTASNWTCCCLSLPELSSSDSNAGEDDLSSSFWPFLSVVSASSFLSLLLTSLPLWWWSTDNFLFAIAAEELFLLSFCTCSSEEPSWPLDLSFVSCAVVGVIATLSALILDSALDVVMPIPAARPFFEKLKIFYF